MPATFTMAPSGARLPLRPTTPPVLVIGVGDGVDHLAIGLALDQVELFAHGAARGGHAILVDQPALRSSFITTGTPPAS
jgi:hypothetical protein